MGLEEELYEIKFTNDVRTVNGGAHRVRDSQLSTPLAPEALEKRRRGLYAYVEARRGADELGVSTMATAQRERSMAVVEGLDRATHRVLRGACEGELLRQFGTDKNGKIKAEIVAGPRTGRIMIIDPKDLEKISGV